VPSFSQIFVNLSKRTVVSSAWADSSGVTASLSYVLPCVGLIHFLKVSSKYWNIALANCVSPFAVSRVTKLPPRHNAGPNHNIRFMFSRLWRHAECNRNRPDACHSSVQRNSVAFIPQAKYTNWATATGRRNLVPIFAEREECGMVSAAELLRPLIPVL
jgi:hypothetical protein